MSAVKASKGAEGAWRSAPVGLGVLDARLRLVEANDRLLEILGCSQADAAATPLPTLLGDDGLAQPLQEAVDEGYSGPLVLRQGSGSSRTVLSCWPLEGRDRRLAVACYPPVSASLDQPAVHERLRLLATAVEQNPDAVFIKDRAGRHLLVNPACADLLGRPLDEILGADVRDLFPAEIADEMWAIDRGVLDTGRAVTLEQELPHRGRGERRIYQSRKLPYRNEEGEVIGIIGFGSDVTETRTAEAELRQSQEKFRQLVEQATDAFFLHDAEGGLIDVNQEACRSLGYSREELLSMTVSDIDTHWTPTRIESEIETLLSNLPTTVEGVHRRKDGSTFPVEVRLGWFEAGESPQLLALARDVTDRKAVEEQLREAQRELEERVRIRTRDLEEANRRLSRQIEERRRVESELRGSRQAVRKHRQQLEALAGGLLELQEADRRRLAGELHDDLTQRLAALAIEAGRLRESNGELPPEIVEGLRAITTQCVELSTDIHRMARQLHPSILEDLGVVDAVRAECEAFQERHGIEMSCEFEGLPEQLSQPISLCLYRVVQESLTNVARHSAAARVRVRLGGDGGRVCLTVADDGRGFRAGGAGSGLGLISMQERVRRLNGVFAIESLPERGTTVQVELPVPAA